ncbi:MAG: hypothetical protein LBN25_03175 [Christensenellaceae bacterium]|nr:hypothetical protein [Christensenellaceae bacterium]
MNFYEINLDLILDRKSKETEEDVRNALFDLCDDYNRRNGKDYLFCKKPSIRFKAVSLYLLHAGECAAFTMEDAALLTGQLAEFTVSCVSEITYFSWQIALEWISHFEPIDLAGSVLEKFGFEHVPSDAENWCKEKIAPNIPCRGGTTADYCEYAKNAVNSPELLNELGRIFDAGKPSFGHPVHYILESVSMEARTDTANILVNALFDNGRLKSKRVAVIRINDIANYSRRGSASRSEANACIKNMAGSTVVLDFSECANVDGEFGNAALGIAEKLSNDIKI